MLGIYKKPDLPIALLLTFLLSILAAYLSYAYAPGALAPHQAWANQQSVLGRWLSPWMYEAARQWPFLFYLLGQLVAVYTGFIISWSWNDLRMPYAKVLGLPLFYSLLFFNTHPDWVLFTPQLLTFIAFATLFRWVLLAGDEKHMDNRFFLVGLVWTLAVWLEGSAWYWLPFLILALVLQSSPKPRTWLFFLFGAVLPWVYRFSFIFLFDKPLDLLPTRSLLPDGVEVFYWPAFLMFALYALFFLAWALPAMQRMRRKERGVMQTNNVLFIGFVLLAFLFSEAKNAGLWSLSVLPLVLFASRRSLSVANSRKEGIILLSLVLLITASRWLIEMRPI